MTTDFRLIETMAIRDIELIERCQAFDEEPCPRSEGGSLRLPTVLRRLFALATPVLWLVGR